jgi:hypothetical protein
VLLAKYHSKITQELAKIPAKACKNYTPVQVKATKNLQKPTKISHFWNLQNQD